MLDAKFSRKQFELSKTVELSNYAFIVKWFNL